MVDPFVAVCLQARFKTTLTRAQAVRRSHACDGCGALLQFCYLYSAGDRTPGLRGGPWCPAPRVRDAAVSSLRRFSSCLYNFALASATGKVQPGSWD